MGRQKVCNWFFNSRLKVPYENKHSIRPHKNVTEDTVPHCRTNKKFHIPMNFHAQPNAFRFED